MGTPGMGGGYEFTEAENGRIRKVIAAARALGIVFFVCAFFALLGCNVLQLLLNIVYGILLMQVAGSLSQVVNTQGNDVMHMLDAVKKIGTVFQARLILLAIAMVLVVVIGGILFLVILGAAVS